MHNLFKPQKLSQYMNIPINSSFPSTHFFSLSPIFTEHAPVSPLTIASETDLNEAQERDTVVYKITGHYQVVDVLGYAGSISGTLFYVKKGEEE